VCNFHVAAGGKLHADKQFIWRPCPECHDASKHHLLKFGSLLLVRFNLGFTTEGRLATVLIILSSWGSQRAVLTGLLFEQLIYRDDWEDLRDVSIAAMDKYRVVVAQSMCVRVGRQKPDVALNWYEEHCDAQAVTSTEE
jgi:hypothetical protein